MTVSGVLTSCDRSVQGGDAPEDLLGHAFLSICRSSATRKTVPSTNPCMTVQNSCGEIEHGSPFRAQV